MGSNQGPVTKRQLRWLRVMTRHLAKQTAVLVLGREWQVVPIGQVQSLLARGWRRVN